MRGRASPSLPDRHALSSDREDEACRPCPNPYRGFHGAVTGLERAIRRRRTPLTAGAVNVESLHASRSIRALVERSDQWTNKVVETIDNIYLFPERVKGMKKAF